MAAENYIRDLSEYLISGNLSDLILNFGEKSWQIHKALACCHSNWFRKAITIGLEETNSGVVTLKDDPGFANAIDCMVSYFYQACYDSSKYDTSEPLLHAQVAIIADKYDCASLYELAQTSFANTVKTVKSDDWAAVATVVYNHTTAEVSAHVELRKLVVAAVSGRRSVIQSILRDESVEELLRSNADLATDLLLYGMHRDEARDVSEHIFICDHCHYAHTGSPDCSKVSSRSLLGRLCPQCYSEPGKMSKRYTHRVDMFTAFSCPSCDGIHTASSMEPELQRQS